MKPKKILLATWNRMEKGFQYNYISRRLKKRQYRSTWIRQIQNGFSPMPYSQTVHLLKKHHVVLNRKMLAALIQHELWIVPHIQKIITSPLSMV